MENYAIESILWIDGAALAWLWLLIRAFRQDDLVGLGQFVVATRGLCLFLASATESHWPLVLFILGGLAVAGPLSYSLVSPVDLELRAKLQDGPKLWSLGQHALQSDAAHEWMASRAFYMQLGGLAVATNRLALATRTCLPSRIEDGV